MWDEDNIVYTVKNLNCEISPDGNIAYVAQHLATVRSYAKEQMLSSVKI